MTILLSSKNRSEELVLKAPPSKSYEHRLLIVNVLNEMMRKTCNVGFCNIVTQINPQDNKDICATKECLKQLVSEATKAKPSKNVYFPCGESGSTLRFLIPVAAALLSIKNANAKRKLNFKCEGRLFERPIDELTKCLSVNGLTITRDEKKKTYIVTGAMSAGTYEISGMISSQFITGLLLALPLLKRTSIIEVTDYDVMQSRHYVDMTLDALRKIDSRIVINTSTGYVVNPELYGMDVKHEMEVEGDWSNGAFLLSLGALSEKGKVAVSSLNGKSSQGDRAILHELNSLGVSIIEKNGTIVVKGNPVLKKASHDKVMTIDCADIPDIAPYLVIVSAFYAKDVLFENTARLRLKECDRSKAICEMARAAGIQIVEEDNSIEVLGYTEVEEDEIELTSSNDHRMAMCAVLIAQATGKTIKIDDIECLAKSYTELIGIVKKEFSV